MYFLQLRTKLTNTWTIIQSMAIYSHISMASYCTGQDRHMHRLAQAHHKMWLQLLVHSRIKHMYHLEQWSVEDGSISDEIHDRSHHRTTCCPENTQIHQISNVMKLKLVLRDTIYKTNNTITYVK